MKKLLLLLPLIFVIKIASAQSSDSLLRAAGFYVSPAATNYYLPESDQQPEPVFGFTLGFRYTNKIKKGFFIEGGAGLSLYGAKYQPELNIEYRGNPPHIYEYFTQRSVSELNLFTPFLVGYQTTKGKVRFQGALGFSFNIRNLEFEEISYDGDPYVSTGNENSVFPRFGTNFNLIARAGIRVPLTQKMSIDILPAARYRFLNFTPEDLDLRDAMEFDENPWSVGLDVGLVFALDNKPPEEIYEYEYSSDTNADYTIKYQEGNNNKPVKRKLIEQGPKNFTYLEIAGSGMIYSNNYERTVFRTGIFSLQARGGFGYGFVFNKFAVPLGANITLGHSRQKFETGVLATMENMLFDKFNVNIVPSIAYRFEGRNHFFLRLALMTHIVTGSDKYTTPGAWLPGLGVSLGGCF